MIVLGLDTSTKTGLVALKCTKLGGPIEVLCAEELQCKGDEKGLDRCSVLAEQMMGYVCKCKPDKVVFENYGFANAYTLATLVEIGTVLRYFIKQSGIPYDLVPPNNLKKFVSGKGTSKKEDMKLAVYKGWGFEHKSNNVIDAYGLALYGLGKYGMLKMTKYQVDSIV